MISWPRALLELSCCSRYGSRGTGLAPQPMHVDLLPRLDPGIVVSFSLINSNRASAGARQTLGWIGRMASGVASLVLRQLHL
jgi:hypothetical protein